MAKINFHLILILLILISLVACETNTKIDSNISLNKSAVFNDAKVDDKIENKEKIKVETSQPEADKVKVDSLKKSKSELLTEIQEPFLWKVGNSYLFGTIHYNTEDVLNLPSVVRDAVASSDRVYIEIIYNSELTYWADERSLMKDQELSDVLPKEVYDRVDKQMTKTGYSILSFKDYKPWRVNDVLPSLTNKFTDVPILDDYIVSIARQNEREVYSLEDPVAHADVYENLTMQEQISLLKRTLEDLESEKNSSIKQAYFSGDLNELKKIDEEYDDDIYQKVNEKLLHERNIIMADRIATLIKENPDKQLFFAVGAGHYISPGVIEYLKQKGLSVERILIKKSPCKFFEQEKNGKCYFAYKKLLPQKSYNPVKCKDFYHVYGKIPSSATSLIELTFNNRAALASMHDGKTSINGAKKFKKITATNYGGYLRGYVEFEDENGNPAWLENDATITVKQLEFYRQDVGISDMTKLGDKKVTMSKDAFKRIYTLNKTELKETFAYPFEVKINELQMPDQCIGQLTFESGDIKGSNFILLYDIEPEEPEGDEK